MTPERYREADKNGSVTREEANLGWHFCYEWDYLLIGPGMPEMSACLCFTKDCPTCGE